METTGTVVRKQDSSVKSTAPLNDTHEVKTSRPRRQLNKAAWLNFALLSSLDLIYQRRYLDIITLFLLGLPKQVKICSPGIFKLL